MSTAEKAPNPNAQALWRFLQTEWDQMGIAPTTWCRKHGIPDPTVLRWRNGIEPDFRSLRRVADALDRSIMDILVAAEYVTPEEAGGHIPQPIMVDAREAIKLDDSVDPILREALLQLFDSYEDILAGVVKEVRATTTGRSDGRSTRTTRASSDGRADGRAKLDGRAPKKLPAKKVATGRR